jgi:S-adenosylmethionine hydrolase
MSVITLTTDFGSTDHETGVLKGVIWKIAPQVKIADLSHDISSYDIIEAALLFWRVVPYFPDGTIHVAVIDPGVGTSRRAIAAHIDAQYFVGPDNGIFSLLQYEAEQNDRLVNFIQLDEPKYWLPDVSNVFHGRDIFAPVAAHLAADIPFSSLGTSIDDPIRLKIPNPVPTQNGWKGQIIHIDHFGNLSTNINRSHLGKSKEVLIKTKGEEITGLVSTFGERSTGTLVALIDSSGSLAISVVNGSAAQLLNSSIGDPVELQLMQ